MITPGSEQPAHTSNAMALLADLEAIGATVLANACGPCIGQWKPLRDDHEAQSNTIVTSFNRNFPKRNDGSPNTLAFVTSPDTVMAIALSGRLDFDPTVDTITAPDGTEVSLDAPVGQILPDAGYDPGEDTFTAPPADGHDVPIAVSPTSDRLQLLEPFEPVSLDRYSGLPVLVKAQGKFTTDHISMAGPWLKYRGHLENISGNLYLGAVNAYEGYEVGFGKNQLTGETQRFPEIAKEYHEADQAWIVIGDENMGEGSSREHAAMEPRFRMGLVAIARSFARIHETNLKKQGVLAMTFADPDFWGAIGESDTISITGLSELFGWQTSRVCTPQKRCESVEFQALHTLNDDQIAWFHAGSALNMIRAQVAG